MPFSFSFHAPLLPLAGPAGTLCGSASSQCWSCNISGTSYNNDGVFTPGGNTIYDDAGGNYEAYNSPYYYSWNCGNEFVLGEYLNQDTSIDLIFTYGNQISPYAPPVHQHYVVVTRPDGSRAGPYIVQDENDFYPGDTTGLITGIGEYTFQYYRPYVYDSLGSTTPGMDLNPDITARIVIMRSINSVSIVTLPVCPTFNAPRYNFQVLTDPPLDSLMFYNHIWAQGPVDSASPLGCDDMGAPEYYFKLDFTHSYPSSGTFSGDPLSVMITDSIENAIRDFPMFPATDFIPIISSAWPSAPPYPDLTDFWISAVNDSAYYDLKSYLVYNTTGNYGLTPTINLTISDILSSVSAAAPINIETLPNLDVDINTRCEPGHNESAANPALLPQYTVTPAGGTAPYTYLWTPTPPVSFTSPHGPITIPTNGAVLDTDTIATPKIISMAGYTAAPPFYTVPPPPVSSYLLTVTDANGCISAFNVRTPLIDSGFDLASRDSWVDMYDEPNTQAIDNPAYWNIWQTPDIWNRYEADGLANQTNEPPEYAASGTTTNYLYVKVRNVGCADYNIGAQPAVLKSYWTMGAFSAETWDSAWDGSGHTPPVDSPRAICNHTVQPLGSEISSFTLPPIHAGGDTAIKMSWTPPNPQLYFPDSCTADSTYMELCFLSRIVDYHNPAHTDGMSIQEVDTGTISANVRNNNNIATINTSIAYVDTLSHPRMHTIIGGNGGLSAHTFSLQFINNSVLYPGTAISHLSQYVSIKVYLGDLFTLWQSAGSHGTYTTYNASEKSVTFDGSHTVQLDDIVMPPRSYYPVEIAFILNTGAKLSQLPDETVSFRQLSHGRVDTLIDSVRVGVVSGNDTTYSTLRDTTYIPDTVYNSYSFAVAGQSGGGARKAADNSATGSNQTETQQSINVYPNPASNTLNFTFPLSTRTSIKMFNLSGQLISEHTAYATSSATLDVSTYTPGLYLYQVITTGQSQSGKIIIQR